MPPGSVFIIIYCRVGSRSLPQSDRSIVCLPFKGKGIFNHFFNGGFACRTCLFAYLPCLPVCLGWLWLELIKHLCMSSFDYCPLQEKKKTRMLVRRAPQMTNWKSGTNGSVLPVV